MADSFTTNYNLTKPEIGGSIDTWGAKLNADLDTLDGALKSVSDVADAALPAAGGTVTGSIAFEGDVTLANAASVDEHPVRKGEFDSALGGKFNTTGGTLTGGLQIDRAGDAYITLNGLSSGAVLYAHRSGTLRWSVAFAGADTAGDFSVARYNDAGTYVNSPFIIERANGVAHFNNELRAEAGLRSVSGVLYLGSGTDRYLHWDGSAYYLGSAGIIWHSGNFTPDARVAKSGDIMSGDLGVQHVGDPGIWLDSSGVARYAIRVSAGDGALYIRNENGGVDNGVKFTLQFSGDIWTPSYGWLHTYIQNQANAYAGNRVGGVRWASGVWQTINAGSGAVDFGGGRVCMGFSYNPGINQVQCLTRVLQVEYNGNYSTVGSAS